MNMDVRVSLFITQFKTKLHSKILNLASMIDKYEYLSPKFKTEYDEVKSVVSLLRLTQIGGSFRRS